jgi:hypothetical protein
MGPTRNRAPGKIRTPGLLVRSLILICYPVDSSPLCVSAVPPFYVVFRP